MAASRSDVLSKELELLFVGEAEKAKPDRTALQELLVRLLAAKMGEASNMSPASFLKLVEVFAKQLAGRGEAGSVGGQDFNSWLEQVKEKREAS